MTPTHCGTPATIAGHNALVAHLRAKHAARLVLREERHWIAQHGESRQVWQRLHGKDQAKRAYAKKKARKAAEKAG